MKLYHYTDLNAVCNIIQNGELWLSHYSCMNDMHEYLAGLKIVRNTIQRCKNDTTGQNSILNEMARLILHDQSEKWGVPFYVFSLTETHDDALMYHAYVGDQAGCCIEFTIDDSEPLLEKVIYDESAIGSLTKECIKKFFCETVPFQRNSILAQCKERMLRLALSYKKHAHRNEREFRLLSSVNNSPKYRANDKRIIAYVPFELTDACRITRVTGLLPKNWSGCYESFE
jgi:hypothetical protein